MPQAKKTAVKKTEKPKVKAKTQTKNKSPRRKKEKDQEAQRLRIKVMAYEHNLLDLSVKQIVDTIMRYNAKIHGPVPLPTEVKRYTVNRSTFVHKDSREQFEMRVHKRLIDIMNPTAQIIDSLTNMTLPSGVSIDVKMM